MSKRKKNTDFIDDGRVIADMSIDGMRHSIISRTAFKKYKKADKTFNNTYQLSRKEHFSAILGIISSYIIFGVVVFGFFALLIMLWFK